MNLLTKQKQIHRFIKQTYGYQRGWRGRDKSGGWDYHIHPHGSDSKESACNAGDLGSILGLRKSSGERIGYPLQYSWASLVAQLVKNLPAMRETWV